MVLTYAKQIEANPVRDLYLVEKVGQARLRRLGSIPFVRDDGRETVDANFHVVSPFLIHPGDDVVRHTLVFSIPFGSIPFGARAIVSSLPSGTRLRWRTISCQLQCHAFPDRDDATLVITP
jgi:hypothetical protein